MFCQQWMVHCRTRLTTRMYYAKFSGLINVGPFNREAIIPTRRHGLGRTCGSFLSVGFFLLCLGLPASAQYGTAPPAPYPIGYSGATFTGKVAETSDDTITLTNTHGSKPEKFEGHTAAMCHMPVTKTTTEPLPLSQVQVGTVVTVFFEPKTVKVEGRKEHTNEIVAISFVQANGKPVKAEHQAIFYCLPPTAKLFFKAFNQ